MGLGAWDWGGGGVGRGMRPCIGSEYVYEGLWCVSKYDDMS